MEHRFTITRDTSTPEGSQRSHSVLADTDKVLKAFEARHPGSRARFVEEHASDSSVVVALSAGGNTEWSEVDVRFRQELADVFLRAAPDRH